MESCTSTPPTRLHGMVLIEAQGQLYFTLLICICKLHGFYFDTYFIFKM